MRGPRLARSGRLIFTCSGELAILVSAQRRELIKDACGVRRLGSGAVRQDRRTRRRHRCPAPRDRARRPHRLRFSARISLRTGGRRADLCDGNHASRSRSGRKKSRRRVLESTLPGSRVKVYLIDQPRYFDRAGLYGSAGKDYDDNCERFVFFNRAVLDAFGPLGIRPDVVHCNDWQTGLIPVYMKTLYQNEPALASAGSLLTIHNLAYLGLFWQREMALTGLDWRLFNWRQLEFHGRICFMKAGLVFADMLSAVSPNYAKEIQTPRYGSGLDGLLRDRQADLRGIVNGIDPEIWSPAKEPMIAHNYDVTTVEAGKAACKAWLQRRAGVRRAAGCPAFRADRPARPAEGLGPARSGRRELLERVTCSSSCSARATRITTPCSKNSPGSFPESAGPTSDSPTNWRTRSRPAPIFS